MWSAHEPAGSGGTPAPPAVQTPRVLWVLIVVATLLRLLLADGLGLSIDESYTVSIARRWAMSYVDHPPLHVWLTGLAARLAGTEAAFAVRLPFVLLSAASTWLLYRLTADAFGTRAGFWAATAFTLAPLLTVATSSWVLPDGPLVCFALLAVWAVTRALGSLSAGGSTRWGWWLVAGVAAGLAMLSKYLAVFPLLGVAVFLLWSGRRRILATAPPWIALLVAVLLSTPVLAWNATHGWASFAFQGARALPDSLSIGRLLLGFAAQCGYLSPLVAVGLILALVRAMRERDRESLAWLLVCLALPAVVCFTLAASWTEVLPHWSAIGWLFAFPLLGRSLAELELRRSSLLRWGGGVTVGLLALLLVIGVSQARTGWLDRIVPGFPAQDPMVDELDWQDLKSALAKRDLLRPDLIVGALSWVDAGKVSYALGSTVPVLCLCSEPHQFALMNDPADFRGREVLVVANAQRADWLALSRRFFRKVEPLPEVPLQRGGRVALTLRLARGIDLGGPDD